MLSVPNRTASARRFRWVPTTYVLVDKQKKKIWIALLSGAMELWLRNAIWAEGFKRNDSEHDKEKKEKNAIRNKVCETKYLLRVL